VLATAFSGLLAAGIFAGLDGARGLAGWRWLFIIEGAASFLAGLVAIFFLPDFPDSKSGSKTKLFSPEECQIAIDRMSRDHVSTTESNRGVWYGLKLAGSDFRVWIFVSQ
jgi:sugar phosphate permease